MTIVQRVKNLLLQPMTEWAVIDAEPASTASLYTTYLIPLALVGTIARFIGITVIGVSVPFIGRFRAPVLSALTSAIIGFLVMMVLIYVWAMIINALAPRFGGQKNMLSALKVAVYAATPALVAAFLSIIPALFFVQILGAIYGLYLLYIAFPILMKAAPDRNFPYLASVVGCGILMGIVVGVAAAALNIGSTSRMATGVDSRKAAEGMVAGMLGAAAGGSKDNKDAAAALVAGMVAAGQKAEESERAAKASGSTDSVAQAGAAIGAAAAVLGTMATGGKEQVELVDFHVLKDLLPGSAGSLRRTNATGEKTTAGGLSGSSAEGQYSGDGNSSATVKISDMGNVRGVLALGKMAFSVESESDNGFEKNVNLNGQRVHEKWRASGKSAELTAFVGDRFMVEVETSGVDVGAAEKLFSSIDVGKLASSK
jgi:hypothetical protein